jgi:hypothetical protein
MTQDKPTPAREPEFYWFHDNGTLTIARVGEDGSVALPGTDQKWDRGQICRGDRDKWGARIPTPAAPAETDKLLALARKCDETADLEAKLIAGEELRSLLGDRYDDFDKSYEAVVLATPDFPRAAEFVLCFVLQMAPTGEEMRDALLRWVMLGTAKMLAGVVSTKRQREAAAQVRGISDATSDSDAAQILGGFFLALLLDPPGLVPAETVAGWLEVAREALRWSAPADLPIDAESNLRAVLQRLAQMMQERLPAQARAE